MDSDVHVHATHGRGLDTKFFERRGVDMDTEFFENRGVDMDIDTA